MLTVSRNSLSLRERWHCVSNDGEGEDAIRYRTMLVRCSIR